MSERLQLCRQAVRGNYMRIRCVVSSHKGNVLSVPSMIGNGKASQLASRYGFSVHKTPIKNEGMSTHTTIALTARLTRQHAPYMMTDTKPSAFVAGACNDAKHQRKKWEWKWQQSA
eukprot:1148648-Pelagomonas_calceolata.AAC.1